MYFFIGWSNKYFGDGGGVECLKSIWYFNVGLVYNCYSVLFC